MKKKLRKIVVDNSTFFWSVREMDWPTHQLTVWNEKEKNDPFLIAPMNCPGAITPKEVANRIKDELSAKQN